MRIVIAFDDNYAPHGATVISSILANTSLPIKVSVIYYELEEDTINSFVRYFKPKLSDIEFHQVKDSDIQESLQVRTAEHLNVACFLRLLIPKFIKEKYAIYFDCDVIVNQDIIELLNYLPANNYVSAVKEYDIRHKHKRMDNLNAVQYPTESYMIRDSYYYRVQQKLGMNSNNFRYFNSGVLIINVEKWKNDGVSERLFDHIAKNNYLFSGDQDSLNCVFDGNFCDLKPKWNNVVAGKGIMTNYTDQELLEAKTNPAVIHFTGADKPWKNTCTYPSKVLYWKHRKNTPWPNLVLEGKKERSLKKRLKKMISFFVPDKIKEIRREYYIQRRNKNNMFATAYIENK